MNSSTMHFHSMGDPQPKLDRTQYLRGAIRFLPDSPVESHLNVYSTMNLSHPVPVLMLPRASVQLVRALGMSFAPAELIFDVNPHFFYLQSRVFRTFQVSFLSKLAYVAPVRRHDMQHSTCLRVGFRLAVNYASDCMSITAVH
jgi:hypothetical protein